VGLLPTPAEAEARIRARVMPLPVETRPLASLAGAVLAQAVRAERDQPPFDRVTMDGVAIATSGWRAGLRRFRIAGVQAAGKPPVELAASDDCIEVMTGAVLPAGADCVVPVELLRQESGWVEIGEDATVEPQANVHPRAQDFREGDLLLSPGTRIGAPELAVIASAGLARAEVRVDPRVVVVSTGDELVEPGARIESWQVRRSNPAALRAALSLRGFQRVAEDHLPDDAGVLRERLSVHLDTYDVVVLSGGVSMGRFDHVPSVLRDLGVEEVFHKVAQRPGRPMWFGVAPGGQVVYGLPGNPVSALVCLARYVVPGLAAAIGAGPAPVEAVPLGAAFHVRPPLAFFLPVALERSPTQGTVAMPKPTRGSGDFVSLLGTDGFVELPPGPADHPAGTVAPFHRW
jgi:molybdopterin molybdotransferase